MRFLDGEAGNVDSDDAPKAESPAPSIAPDRESDAEVASRGTAGAAAAKVAGDTVPPPRIICRSSSTMPSARAACAPWKNDGACRRWGGREVVVFFGGGAHTSR